VPRRRAVLDHRGRDLELAGDLHAGDHNGGQGEQPEGLGPQESRQDQPAAGTDERLAPATDSDPRHPS
jgi:hypothetical protein